MPKLTVLPLQGLQLLGHLSWNANPLPAVNFGPLDPVMQRLRCAADLGRNRCHRRPARRVLAGVIQNHPDRTIADLRRKLVRRLACHGSILSGVGASGKSGAVQVEYLDPIAHPSNRAIRMHHQSPGLNT